MEERYYWKVITFSSLVHYVQLNLSGKIHLEVYDAFVCIFTTETMSLVGGQRLKRLWRCSCTETACYQWENAIIRLWHICLCMQNRDGVISGWKEMEGRWRSLSSVQVQQTLWRRQQWQFCLSRSSSLSLSLNIHQCIHVILAEVPRELSWTTKGVTNMAT